MYRKPFLDVDILQINKFMKQILKTQYIRQRIVECNKTFAVKKQQ